MRRKVLALIATALLSNAATALGNENVIELRIASIEKDGKISLMLENVSEAPVKIWQESNSWGASRFRVLRLRGDAISLYYNSPDHIFTANMPTSEGILPRKQLRKFFDLNGSQWRRPDEKPVSFIEGDRVIVIYDVPRTPESRRLEVWNGLTAVMETVSP